MKTELCVKNFNGGLRDRQVTIYVDDLTGEFSARVDDIDFESDRLSDLEDAIFKRLVKLDAMVFRPFYRAQVTASGIDVWLMGISDEAIECYRDRRSTEPVMLRRSFNEDIDEHLLPERLKAPGELVAPSHGPLGYVTTMDHLMPLTRDVREALLSLVNTWNAYNEKDRANRERMVANTAGTLKRLREVDR